MIFLPHVDIFPRASRIQAVTSPFSRIKLVSDTSATEPAFEGVAIEVLDLIAQRYHFR